MNPRGRFELAQVNVARPLGPPGSDVLADFMALLEPINALADAEERLAHLREHGPTPFAFTLRSPFPSPSGEQITSDDDWLCPA